MNLYSVRAPVEWGNCVPARPKRIARLWLHAAGRTSVVVLYGLSATKVIHLSRKESGSCGFDSRKWPVAVSLMWRRSRVGVVRIVAALGGRCEAGVVPAPRDSPVGRAIAKISVQVVSDSFLRRLPVCGFGVFAQGAPRCRRLPECGVLPAIATPGPARARVASAMPEFYGGIEDDEHESKVLRRFSEHVGRRRARRSAGRQR